MHPLSWITKVSTAALTNCNLDTIKCFEHLWSFHTFKFGNILFATKEIPAQCQMFGFASGTKYYQTLYNKLIFNFSCRIEEVPA